MSTPSVTNLERNGWQLSYASGTYLKLRDAHDNKVSIMVEGPSSLSGRSTVHIGFEHAGGPPSLVGGRYVEHLSFNPELGTTRILSVIRALALPLEP